MVVLTSQAVAGGKRDWVTHCEQRGNGTLSLSQSIRVSLQLGLGPSDPQGMGLNLVERLLIDGRKHLLTDGSLRHLVNGNL